MGDYVKANTALLTSVPLVMTVEATVAQRRLQEQYCLRAAFCEVAGGTLEDRTMRVALSFNKCLEEEAKEKYELVARPDN
jgi:hypothetical protein